MEATREKVSEHWLGLDIGGANIKAACSEGKSQSLSFHLWKQPQRLASCIAEIIHSYKGIVGIAVTMTGELADCFCSKREGVEHIVKSVVIAAGKLPVRVYLTNGEFADPNPACKTHVLAAASNWHAMASFATRFTGPANQALVIDIGSTTCDLIPILNGKVASAGTTDTQRLLSGELLYMGVDRTPLCALVDTVPYRDEECPVARELFATLLDIYLVLGDMRCQELACDTADGRPASHAAAVDRIRRCLCADVDEFDRSDALVIADYVADVQAEMLGEAIDRVADANGLTSSGPVILGGHGDFLYRRAIKNTRYQPDAVVSLGDTIDAHVSRCGPAFAVAVLASALSQG